VVCKVVKLALLLAVGAIACDRGRSNPPSPTPSLDPPAPAAPQPKPTSCTLSPVALRYPMPKRLVAIGDLHGDLAGMRSALVAAGAIDDKDTWIGGDLMIVQTGDVLDRGDDEQAMIDLILKLEGQAKAAGGSFVWLMGNHELMNAAGDFRYVTPGAMRDFDDAPGLDTSAWARVPERARGRIAALGPGGVYAKKIAQHNVIAIVGDTVFSHAGVLPEWAAQLDGVNQASRCWLDGQAGGVDKPAPAMTGDSSPVWTRAFGGDPVDCAVAKESLAKLGVKRQVVGHTVQPKGVNGVCDDGNGPQIWRIDVGLAKLYGGPIEVLELTPDKPPRVLKGVR